MFKLPNTSREIASRLKLIEKENLYPVELLKKFLTNAQKGKLSPQDIEKVKLDFHSDEFGFDELYRIKLIATNWLLNIDSKSDNFVKFIDWDAKRMSWLESAGMKVPERYFTKEYIPERKEALKDYGKNLHKQVKDEVRCRLALLEIFTRISPNELIPDLIAICPRYLGCPFIQKWIMAHQYHSKYCTDEKSNDAAEFLKKLTKAIKPDKRKKKRQATCYWGLEKHFQKLTRKIQGNRIAYKEGKFDHEYFNIFCDLWEIPETYRGHFISNEIGAKEIALSIMVDQGKIKSERAFREFQPKLSKLKKKHKGIEITLVLEDILDFFIIHPELLDNPTIWNLLD